MPPSQTRNTERRPRESQRSASSVNSAIFRPKTVLLAVTGMSPAILTETAWALADENPPIVPDEVVVLTTSAGKKQIIQELFTAQPHFNHQTGWDCLLQKLQEQGRDTNDRLRFDPNSDDLRVFTLRKQRRKLPLNDIRTAAENEAVADSILEVVRAIVENPDTQLIASIAGGRKTMGTLLYACMTLIGREKDRITHVLVDEPFDDPRLEPKFYFPEQPQNGLTTPHNKLVHAKDAKIVLADLPFVPIRNLFKKELGKPPGGFMTLVNRWNDEIRQRAAADLKLVVHKSRPAIEVNGISIILSAREQVLVLFLANRIVLRQPPFGSYAEGEDALNEYRQKVKSSARGENPSDWRWALGRGSRLIEGDIRRALSNVAKKLMQAGPDAMALIDRLPKHGRLSIDLPPDRITITD
jgi:CRISPR-associated protein (TIGR02584 family)